MNEEIRQKMIVRQSSLKLAVDLLMDEQNRTKSEVMIPIAAIKDLTKELESFVWELDIPDNRTLSPEGKVVEPKKLVM